MGACAAPKRFRRALLLLAFALLFSLASNARATTLYVSKSGDGSNGLSWETAFNTISAALVASVTNDEIRVSAETYTENIEINVPLTIVGGWEFGAETDTPIGRTTITSGGKLVQIFAHTMLRNFIVTGGQSGGGTGLDVTNAEAVILDCIIDNNYADYAAAGISCYKASVTIQDCTISNNTAKISGGGIFCIQGDVALRDSIIHGNTCLGIDLEPGAGDTRDPGKGGGLYLNNSNATIVNCSFHNNNAEEGTDIYYRGGGSLSCTNCTLGSTSYPNVFKRPFGSSSGITSFSNSIIWGHANPFEGGDWLANYSNIRGGFSGVGNIDQDPLFVDPENGDFRLQAGSPCIDSASITGPATDLEGNPRPFDVPGLGRNGTGDEFDMGAYEFIPAPTPAPTFVNERSDIDGSRRVDATDLLILLGDWMKATGASR